MMAQMGAEEEDAHGSAVLRVVVVCTGNICRSPMAEVVLRDACATLEVAGGRLLSELVVVESEGTSNWHAGDEMDPRARDALDNAGYHAVGSTAVQVSAAKLATSTHVVALDRGHRAELQRLAPDVDVTLLRWWSEGLDLDVPDPFYGDASDFQACLELIEPACRALAKALAEGAN